MLQIILCYWTVPKLGFAVCDGSFHSRRGIETIVLVRAIEAVYHTVAFGRKMITVF